MDLTTSPTTKTPDSENDTPPQPRLKPLSFTNCGGATAKHHRHAPPYSAAPASYRECLKNHAAAMGGHAVDGCGEFMPSPESTAADPASLTCAACGCHRNFHRRSPPPAAAAEDFSSFSASPTHTQISSPHFIDFRRPIRRRSSPSPPPPPLLHLTPVTPTAAAAAGGGRKRFRTKFSQEQKEKMQDLSERLGWKIQKSDESIVEKFCSEIGVSRGVLKVWMHNNKNTLGKKDVSNGGSNVSNGGAVKNDVVENNGNFNDNSGSNTSHCHNNNDRNNNVISGGDLNLHISTN